MNKNLRRFAAVTLAATMVLGGTLTAFAAEQGVSEGEGTYEGGELQYPTLSVTLPTIPEGTYDYIADPNGLIAETDSAKYENATFTGTTGIFFLTSTDDDGNKTYTEKSAAMSVINENAQNIDVTVKLEQLTAGDEAIVYSDTAAFEDTDTANKLYLALTDDADTDAKVSALSSTTAATLTTTVAGVPENYQAGYTADNGYGYELKAEGDLADWNSCSFIMTGAINTNATWGDDVAFPTIKVTWSYAEHSAAPTVPTVSATTIANNGGSVDITYPAGVTITEIQKVKSDGVSYNTLPTDYYTLTDIANGKQLELKDLLTALPAATSIKIIFSEGDPITLSVTK